MNEQSKKTRHELEQQYNHLQENIINAPQGQRKTIIDERRPSLLLNIKLCEDLKDINAQWLASQVEEHFESLLNEAEPTPLPFQFFENKQRSDNQHSDKLPKSHRRGLAEE